MVFRTRLLAHLNNMLPMMYGKFHNSPQRYKHYFDYKIKTMPKSHIGKMVYVDRPSLLTLTTDINAEKWNKLLPGAYGPFQILQVTEPLLTGDENSSENIISTDRETLVAATIEHSPGFKASINSSKEKPTL